VIHIVGAGPAGLITSLFLLEKGEEIHLLEGRERIKSSACGEGCDAASLKKIPFDSMPYISKEVEGVKCLFREKYFYGNKKGYVLDRQKWLEGMADEVIRRGGRISFSSRVEKINSHFLYTKGEKIRYDVCIGADGPLSVIKNYFGNRYEYMLGCQYEIEFDTKEMNYLEFYFDKDYSSYYLWIFPKEKSINAGCIGKFENLDAFLKEKKIGGKIIGKKAGLIPCNFADKIADERVALIGDAAAITNPFTLGGISSIIHAAEILAENIDNLVLYNEKLKRHPVLSPLLIKGKKSVEGMYNEDFARIFEKINGKEINEIKIMDFVPLLLNPSLLIKAYNISRAFLHSMELGW